LCDFNRKSKTSDLDRYTGDINNIVFVASTNINSYLARENKKLEECDYIPLRKEGVERHYKLCLEEMQITLKIALNKVSGQDLNTRLGTTDYKMEFI
jgi:hypothetical protein